MSHYTIFHRIFRQPSEETDPMPARESMIYRATGDGRRHARHVRRDRRGRFAPPVVPSATRAGWMI